ncbi:MAG: hypothetical protein RL385_3697, partial [Pseudomonadota bacterium]
HRDLSVVPRHLHLPVQSGSDRMLKRMLRRYTAADYLERVSALREQVPGLTLSTDIIVGFPGETDEDFEATLRLVQQVGFVSLFGFKYSPRPHTPALNLVDDVPEGVKDERLQRLFALSNTITEAHLASCVDTFQDVLIDGQDPERPRRFSGRSERNELVHVDAPEGVDPRGQIVRVHVFEAFKHSLHGTMEGVIAVADTTPQRRPRKTVKLPLATA